MAPRKLTDHEVSETAGLDDWRVVRAKLRTRLATGDFVTGARLVARITELAEELNHHPDLTLQYPHLDIDLSTHDVNGLSDLDVEAARRISELARDEGVSADPSARSEVVLALDVTDRGPAKAFWAAVLDLDEHPTQSDELVDPDGRVAGIWFQSAPEAAESIGAMRFHVDVIVPHDRAEARVQAALDAGGTLVTDEYAPSWWVLADPEGNKACVCTWQDREQP